MLNALLLLLLASPPEPPPGPLLTRDFAKMHLSAASALDGQPVRVSFVVQGRPAWIPWGSGRSVLVEGEGPDDAVRGVWLTGDVPHDLGAGDRLVAEGLLRVRYWPPREIDGERFVRFWEITVEGAV